MASDKLIQNADLSALSTFKLPARARQLLMLSSVENLKQDLLSEPNLLILGGGSNTVFLSDWPGLVVLNQLKGLSARPDGDEVVVSVGAGESWHGLVRHCLDQGWYGLENLILIPGSVGAAPIQNIGAYGVELSSVVEQVVTWDRLAQETKIFGRDACQFAYRDSIFKTVADDRYLITQVDFRLQTVFEPRADYPSLKQALAHHKIDQVPTQDNAMQRARELAATIMRLRRHRLPDPNRIANVGSFFKNPIVSTNQLKALIENFSDLPHWGVTDPNQGEGAKLSAAWMIERLGFKGKQIGDAAVYTNHALVLVNQGHATAADLETLIGQITDAVWAEFGVLLTPEPRLIKASASGH
ncbi:MAG TPA: UDP-N-acetylmuramate dehydrogenase [Wenzhouxiangella sp.]